MTEINKNQEISEGLEAFEDGDFYTIFEDDYEEE